MSDNDISTQFNAVDAIIASWKHREIVPVLEQPASGGSRRGRRTGLAVG
jgi:hypothetical protein